MVQKFLKTQKSARSAENFSSLYDAHNAAQSEATTTLQTAAQNAATLKEKQENHQEELEPIIKLEITHAEEEMETSILRAEKILHFQFGSTSLRP